MLAKNSSSWLTLAQEFFASEILPRVNLAKAQQALLLSLPAKHLFSVTTEDVLKGTAMQRHPLLSSWRPGYRLIDDTEILATPHFVHKSDGLHLCYQPVTSWCSELDQYGNFGFEALAYTLWTGLHPTTDQAEKMGTLLSEARQAIWKEFPFLQICRVVEEFRPLLENQKIPPMHTLFNIVLSGISAESSERQTLYSGAALTLEQRFVECYTA